jgi:biopolymer transport protein ExbD
MRLTGRRHLEEASFDLTPMIDVVMLLIVFFTLTAQFTRTEQAPLDLPAQEGDPGRVEPAKALYVDLESSGRISIEGTGITLLELAQPHWLGADPGAIDVIVRADKASSIAKLNEVARTLQVAGVTRWKLATAPEGK